MPAVAFLAGAAARAEAPPVDPSPFPAPAPLQAPPWPEWAHRHWIWEPGGTEASVTALVREYREHGIPVGAVILDRPWETHDNSLLADPARYPDLGRLVRDLHAQDVKVMLWITSIVNADAENFEEGKRKGYFVGGGKLFKWWAGKGALLDYRKPEAVEWWHRQLDPILDLGIDGWKCDATDPAIALADPARTIFTLLGTGRFPVWDHYKEAFYRDFFDYTRSRLGPDRIITARPVDAYATGIPWKFAPTDINFAGWVGDQDPTFGGLRQAVTNMALSAHKKYVSFGSDIGAYRTGGDGGVRDTELFVRWAQLGALSTVMENGGQGEHRPWMYGEEALRIYREYALLHQELIPFLYSVAARARELGESAYRSVEKPEDWAFTYGDTLLVAPILYPKGVKTVRWPAGEWVDFLDEETVERPGYRKREFALDRYPVYVRRGSILPMDIQRADSRHGSPISPGHLTVLVRARGLGDRRELPLYRPGAPGAWFRYARAEDALRIEATGPVGKPLLYRVSGEAEPLRALSSEGAELPRATSFDELARLPTGWLWDGKRAWIRVAAQDGGEVPGPSQVTLEWPRRPELPELPARPRRR